MNEPFLFDVTLNIPQAMSDDERKELMEKSKNECKSELSISDDDMDLLEEGKQPESEDGKCYHSCMHGKLEIVR